MQKFSHRKSGCHGTGVRTAEKSDKQHKDRKKTHVKLYLNNKNHLRRAIASEWMKELKVSFRTMAELRAQQQGQRMWEAAIQMPMKNADPAKPSTGQSIRKKTQRDLAPRLHSFSNQQSEQGDGGCDLLSFKWKWLKRPSLWREGTGKQETNGIKPLKIFKSAMNLDISI